MSDPAGGQPSEEELRAYMEQLRSVDPAEIVAQAFSMLASAAQVKLGQPDARVLIDSLAGIVDATQGKVEARLSEGMRAAVGQLQTAQVQAEGEHGLSARPEPGAAEAGQPAAGDAPPAGPRTSEPPPSAQRATDRLWIPGRDQPPRR
ncbi:MAG TPA: hypothetical protein VML96_06520 [Egibacteraceae bacterium]|nr:hypothetical protein [Egibacteraceae bacterium]